MLPFFVEKSPYDRIYETACDLDLDEGELNRLLCSADETMAIGTDELHRLLYKLAERGFLDEEALDNYLREADRISASP